MTALRFPYRKPTVLGALIRNESGGRNVANTHQGTSSGQAQGYFQITTGTWNDFGGRKYAPTPMGASYEQQAEIASKIPLRRWDKSTLAAMRGTGRAIDPNRTLGENLSMNQENFDTSAPAAPRQGPTQTGGTLAATPQQAQQQGPTESGATLDTTMTDQPPSGLFPPAANELTGKDRSKNIGGLLGDLQQQAEPSMANLLPHGGGGAPQPSLAELIQKYMASQMRPSVGAMPPTTPPQGGSGLG